MKMSGFIRSLSGSAACLPGLFRRNFLVGKKQLYSTCWNCMKVKNVSVKYTAPVVNSYSKLSAYSTQSIGAQFAKFLDEEIAAEQQSQSKLKPIPSQFGGFEVKLNGSEITLVKQTPVETIEILLNVNESLQDSGEPDDVETQQGDGESGTLKSAPPFQIEIKRGDTILRLMCAYEDLTEEIEDEQNDVFRIEELAVYKGKWEDTNYAVDGSVLDPGIYDMLLGVLDEKGITNEFVYELSELCTSYEHTSYVSLLRDLKKFVA